MPMKQMQTDSLYETCRAQIGAGESVWLRITGNSMAPFLVDSRNSVCLAAIKTPVRRGDIILYRRENGSLVLHRVYAVKKEGLFFVGDGQRKTEGPVREDALVARAVSAKRKGIEIGQKDLLWLLFRTVWLWVLPLRKTILAAYRLLRRKKA